MSRLILAVAAAASATAIGIAPASPQSARAARSLQIVNTSPRSVVEFVVFQEDVHASLQSNIPPGKRASLALPAFASCKVSYSVGLKDVPPQTKDLDLCRTSIVYLKEE